MLMKAMQTRTLVFLVLFLPGTAIEAQGTATSVDPAVLWVVTGGRWTAEGVRGHFRVIVRDVGWDHVSSAVTIEWVAEDPRTSSYRVVRTQVVFDPDANGPWAFGEPTIEANGTYLDVTVEGTNPYTLETGELRFQAGPLDSVIVIAEGSVGHWDPHVR